MPATDQAEPPSKTPPVEALASEAATVQAAAVEPPSMSTSGSSKPTSKWAGGPRNVTGTREGGDLQIIGARRPLGDSEQPTAVEAPPPDETMLPEDREKLDALFGLALTAKGPKDYNALATTFLEDHNEQLRVDPWSMSDRKLADAIGCSESTASTLPVWKAFKYRRGPKRKRGPGKAPPVVSFTEKVDATVGKPDEQLQRLIDEGQYDPSPLDDDLPGEPRRVKLKHRKP
ncbi:MAG TPA: hypothetical protein VFW87_22630 [Pirellulales bacterium]|nr:hypothetical protein [Pirellulales bacterium]